MYTIFFVNFKVFKTGDVLSASPAQNWWGNMNRLPKNLLDLQIVLQINNLILLIFKLNLN